MSVVKVVDRGQEDFEHPMSGYMGSYNTLRVETEIREHDDGKFSAKVKEAMYCGDEEDADEFYKSDREIRAKHKSPKFDTADEAWNWVETAECIDWDPE
jgi:hypothetical protein